jgi:hypothetical protein
MRMGRLFWFVACAALSAAAMPSAALDFSPLVLRRADTQGLVSELFLYDLTPLEVHQLRLRLSQPVMEDELALSYEPTLADIAPSVVAASGDKLLSMLRPVGKAQPGDAQDAVLVVFQGTTLHARRYRMAFTPVALNSTAPTGPAKASRPEQAFAALNPDAPADAKSVADATSAAALSDIASAVKRWAGAWEQRDVAAYAAAYERDFRGAGALSPLPTHAAWLAQRRERIASKRAIEVRLEDVQISLLPGTQTESPRAHVRFLQRYRGDAVISVARKRLGLILRDGAWLIREEVSL